jgi:glutathione S-transferase
MSVELYHAEPVANSLKVLLAFKEKGFPFTSHLVRLNKFEQHEPWFVKINPNGQVPVLVHDGNVVTESTVINEYADEVFEGPALRPADALGKAHMRIWTKFVDEYFCPALSFLGWHRIIKGFVKDLSPEEFEAKIARIPLKEQQVKWREAADRVWPQDQLDDWVRKCRVSIERMEKQLSETEWLAGPTFSLADISCFAMAYNMDQTYPDFVNEKTSPRVMDWHARMHARPGVKAAFDMPNHLREMARETA